MGMCVHVFMYMCVHVCIVFVHVYVCMYVSVHGYGCLHVCVLLYLMCANVHLSIIYWQSSVFK